MKNDLEDYEEIVSPEARGDRYYQVLREGELYGFFCLEQRGERTLELGLGMKPEHCGKGQGAAFLQEILGFIMENFAPQVISLSVADFNHRAQQLYLNMGFEVVRRIPQEAMAIFISLWRWRRRSNFRLYCKAADKLVDSQEKVVQYT